MTIPYREHVPKYTDVWDWDIILFYGMIKIVGFTTDHLDHCASQTFGAKCKCNTGSKISSPVMRYGKQLEQDFYDENKPGDGRLLLEAKDGMVLQVRSGKAYRLVGERVEHEVWKDASIFNVYREEPEPEPVVINFWSRVLNRVLLRKAS